MTPGSWCSCVGRPTHPTKADTRKLPTGENLCRGQPAPQPQGLWRWGALPLLAKPSSRVVQGRVALLPRVRSPHLKNGRGTAGLPPSSASPCLGPPCMKPHAPMTKARLRDCPAGLWSPSPWRRATVDSGLWNLSQRKAAVAQRRWPRLDTRRGVSANTAPASVRRRHFRAMLWAGLRDVPLR